MITPRFLTPRRPRHRRAGHLARLWRTLTNPRTPDQPTILYR